MKLLQPVPPSLAPALGILAGVLLEQGHIDEAVEAAQQAMSILAAAGGMVEEGEALIRLAFVRALAADGRNDEAEEALAIALERLRTRAAAVADAEQRNDFLRQVPDHAQTVALASRWGIG